MPFNPAPFIPGNDANGRPRSTLANAEQRVPFLPGIYSPGIRQMDDVFTSAYHSMQLELNRRFSRGLQFNSSYTLSKSIDSISSLNLSLPVPDPFNLRHGRGPSDWDRRHALVFSGIWTPYARQDGVLGRLTGGWSLAGITTIQSGSPLTFTSGQDTMLHGTGQESRADLVGDPKRSHDSTADMIGRFFDTGAFGQPQLGSPGTSGRGILSGPARVNTDLAVLKDLSLIHI